MIIVRDECLVTLMKINQRNLRETEPWCTITVLSIEPKKTGVIVFTRHYKWNEKPLMGSKAAVEISYTHIKEYSRLWEVKIITNRE